MLRHIVALAVVGWYSMVPPNMSETNWVCSGSLIATVSHKLFGTGDEAICKSWAGIEDMNAPLSEWHEASPFETLHDCEEAEDRLSAASRLDAPEQGAKCIASDDPRLKQ